MRLRRKWHCRNDLLYIRAHGNNSDEIHDDDWAASWLYSNSYLRPSLLLHGAIDAFSTCVISRHGHVRRRSSSLKFAWKASYFHSLKLSIINKIILTPPFHAFAFVQCIGVMAIPRQPSPRYAFICALSMTGSIDTMLRPFRSGECKMAQSAAIDD